jgi:hypothetical protein
MRKTGRSMRATASASRSKPIGERIERAWTTFRK